MITQADQWILSIREDLHNLDEELEIDDYARSYASIKRIRAKLDLIQDSMMDFLTAGEPQTESAFVRDYREDVKP